MVMAGVAQDAAIDRGSSDVLVLANPVDGWIRMELERMGFWIISVSAAWISEYTSPDSASRKSYAGNAALLRSRFSLT